MITPTTWSRSEWLRRLGFKTGDMPPIAAAFTPTLASGDASELLPPLLAPQGWAGGIGIIAGAARYSCWEIRSGGIGGTFISAEVGATHFLHFTDSPVGTFLPSSTKTIQEVVPGVTSRVRDGDVSGVVSTSDPMFVEGFGIPFLTPIYIPPGTFLYAYANMPATALSAAFLIRDVPAGNAGD